MKTLEELLSFNLHMASDLLIKQGSLSPMFVLMSPKNELTLIATPWGSDDEKDQCVAAVQHKMRQDGTVAYVHLAEAWMAKVDMKTNPEMMNIAPSKRNDRMEVVIVVASDHLDTKAGMLEILRDDTGKITGTKPCQLENSMGFGGRMVELLR